MIDAPSWRYTPALAEKIELKWQKIWKDEGCFFAANAEGALRDGEGRLAGKRKPYTVLDMFPFPSGKGLHVGHPLGYIATDFVSRFKRMQGYNVLHALGFDAFGLPAEQFAIATGQHPRKTTEENIANMRRQLSRLGLSFDPRRSFATTDPDYMKWTQWIFARLYSSYYDPDFLRPDGKKGCARPIEDLVKEFESGKRKTQKPWKQMSAKEKSEALNSFRLAYISDSFVNWCPGLGTVLANEEVTKEGKSERGNWPVYRKRLRQWSMRITAYADRLLEDLDGLDWPETVKAMQKNWIGKREGLEAAFEVAGEKVDVFLPYPSLLSHPSFLVLPSSFSLNLPEKWPKEAKEEWKEGASSPEALFSSFKSSHPYPLAHSMDGVFSGLFVRAGEKDVPVFISDYVSEPHLGIEGEEDAKFARIHSIDQNLSPSAFDTEEEALKAAEEKGIGKREQRYRLRDWLFSRQRYWGEPFPIVYSEDGVEHLLPDCALPVTLPSLPDYRPKSFDPDDSSSLPTAPLARNEEWVQVELDLGDGLKKYRRETNTMPNWAGSCWYYLRYMDPHNDNEFVSKEAEEYWGPVDWYNGGMEHTTLHLLYSRFWHKFLYDIGVVHTKEPYAKRTSHGMILGKNPNYIGNVDTEEEKQALIEKYGSMATRPAVKMSKSLGNVVNPDDVIKAYGADTMRLYIMFIGDFEKTAAWSDEAVKGSKRFLDRCFNLQDMVSDEEGISAANMASVHKTIKKVGSDIDELKMNTAIAALMTLVNEFYAKGLSRGDLEVLIQLLSPFVPHMAEEMWENMGFAAKHGKMAMQMSWPEYDESKTIDAQVEMAVQVNGKLRGTVIVPTDSDEATVVAAAMEQERVKKATEGMQVVKTILVKNKLVNLIVKPAK